MSKKKSMFFGSSSLEPWNPSKLVITTNTLASGDSSGVFFKPDGLELYTSVFPGTVSQWTLTSAFDLSTASLTDTFVAPNNVLSLSFRESDGEKMYTMGGASFQEFDLSTGWDLTTISINSNSVAPTFMSGIYIKQDGTTVFSVNSTTDLAYEYDLPTIWDASTFSFTESKDISTELLNSSGIFWNTDGTRVLLSGSVNEGMVGYDVSPVWEAGVGMVYNSAYDLAGSFADSWWTPDGLRCFTASGFSGIIEYEIQ